MTRVRQLLPLSLVVAVLACEGTPSPTDTIVEAAYQILDAAHSDGNSGFYFLPPMVGAPAHSGIFDATLAPVVEICEWDGACVGAPVSVFSSDPGSGSETVRIDPEGENYIVNWHTGDYGLDPAATYRVQVLVAGTLLGYADVDVVSSGKQLRNVDTGAYVPLKDGRTLPIKFRIEEGAVFVLGPGGGSVAGAGGAVVLELPPGALPGEVGITVAPDVVHPPDRGIIPGASFEFGPDGLTFAEPVALIIQYEESALPPGLPETALTLAKQLHAAGDLWLQTPSVVDPVNNTVTGFISGFSNHGVQVVVASVDVAPDSATLLLGDTIVLVATPRDTLGNPLAGQLIVWESTDSAVTAVNSAGLVSAVDVGSASITASAGAAVGTSAVEVIAPLLQPGDLCTAHPAGAIASFADANLEGAVRAALSAGPTDPLTCQLLTTVDTLHANGLGIADLLGIQNLTDVVDVELLQNTITDVTPLSGLTQLDRLRLNFNDVSDLSPLSGLTALTWLSLTANASLTDLGPLSGLTNLQILGFALTGVSDLGPLSGLISLRFLEMFNTPAADLSPLASLTDLQTLRANGTSVTDLSPLTNLASLTSLWLANNTITNVGPLVGLTSLSSLRLSNNPDLADIQPLIDNSGLGAGDAVTLSGTQVPCVDQEVLRARGVSVSGAGDIRDANLEASVLAALGLGPSDPLTCALLLTLTSLQPSGAGIVRLAGLEAAENLQVFRPLNNAITDVTPLRGMTSLWRLALTNNPVSDISSLAGLTSLRLVGIGGTNVSDISALAGLLQLTYVEIGITGVVPPAPVSDLTPLLGLPGLNLVRLGTNSLVSCAQVNALRAAGVTVESSVCP